MGLLHSLKLRPPTITDPAFGSLVFMFVSYAPERSYWEGEWTFPPTGTVVSIALPGGEDGPLPDARQFYLSLPGRYEWILTAVRPRFEEAFRCWRLETPKGVFGSVRLAGFGLEDPTA